MPRDAKLSADDSPSSSAAAINDLSATTTSYGGGGVHRRWPFPPAASCALAGLLAASLGVGALVLAVVHNAFLLAASLLLALLLTAAFLWNAAAASSGRGLRRFADGFPASSLRAAADGQLVKVTGWGSQVESAKNGFYRWKLTHVERFAADFYITDAKSGIRALVKAGHNSKVVPLINESLLVNTTSRNRELSSTLKAWLEERNLSSEAQLLCLEEGCITEGMSVTVMGMLSKRNGVLMILPPPEPVSTGCLLLSFLLPIDVDGLLIRMSNKKYFVPNSGVP